MERFRLSVKKVLPYFLRIAAFVPAVLTAVMIFGFSAQDAEESSQLSTEVTTVIVEGVNRQMRKGWSAAEQAVRIIVWEFYVRKAAHFSEYALLGLTLSIPMYICGVRKRKLPVSAGIICLLYAILDEFHQNFSYGRSPQIRDVIIDTCGALLGILIGWLIARTVARKIRKA